MSEDEFQAMLGFIISSIILKSYCVEVLLKTLHFLKEKKRAEKTHDLYKLFNDLNKETRNSIINISKEKHVDINDIIKRHKDDFWKWRYPFEGKELKMSELTDLDLVMEILCAAEDKIYGGTKFELFLPNQPQENRPDHK